jgi:GDP-D-mannose dehydratase
VELLIGDATKAKYELGWVAKQRWKSISSLMIDADLAREQSR